VAYLGEDPFHPGQLVKVYEDAAQIASAQLMGYGVLDGINTPVVRLFYDNGSARDVFDAWHIWAK
jgi:hypothetical protein